MAFYPCLQAVSSPTPSSTPSIALVANITTSGSSTYTITENGLYLLIVSDSYQGSRSITLPSGRTPIINETIETSYGSTIVVVELQANDVVTLDATPGGWLAFSKQVYKLSNLSVVSLYGKQANNDGTYSYTVPSIGQYLVVGICFGLSTQLKQYTDETEQSTVCRSIANEVGLYAYTRIYIDEGTNIPELTLFGYDGGGVNYLALNVTY